MTRRPPRSTFLGPQRAIQVRYPDWQILVQLHNIEPGEFWDPGRIVQLHTPRILEPHPTAAEALFSTIRQGFLWQFRIGPNRNWIRCFRTTFPQTLAFDLQIPFAVQKFAYNDQVDPAGVYGINGSATLSWQRIP